MRVGQEVQGLSRTQSQCPLRTDWLTELLGRLTCIMTGSSVARIDQHGDPSAVRRPGINRDLGRCRHLSGGGVPVHGHDRAGWVRAVNSGTPREHPQPWMSREPLREGDVFVGMEPASALDRWAGPDEDLGEHSAHPVCGPGHRFGDLVPDSWPQADTWIGPAIGQRIGRSRWAGNGDWGSFHDVSMAPTGVVDHGRSEICGKLR